MKIVFATGNPGKIREAAEILGEGFELVTPAEIGITEDLPETGNTLRANSMQKADYIYKKTGMNCFADDSGLTHQCHSIGNKFFPCGFCVIPKFFMLQ